MTRLENLRCFLLLTSFATAAGCGPADAADSPRSASGSGSMAQFGVFPDDLRTDMRQFPGIWVATAQLPEVFGATVAPQLARAIRLVEWPSGTAVPGQVRITAPMANVDYRYLFEYVPEEPVSDGWYALEIRLSELPDGYSRFAPEPEPDRRGVIRHRFASFSYPLAYVAVRSSESGTTLVDFGADEPLVLGAEIDQLVTMSDGTTTESSCHPVGDRDVEGDLRASGRATLDCGSVSLAGLVSVRIRSGGLQSLSGVPLRTVRGETDISYSWTPATEGFVAPRELSDSFFMVSTSARAGAR